MTKKLLTAQEAADLLGVSRDWVYDNKAKLGVVRLTPNGPVRFREEAVELFIASRTQPPKRKTPMTALKLHSIDVVGFSPEIRGSAAAENTTLDVPPGKVRELTNVGGDDLLVHPVSVTEDGHTLDTPVSVPYLGSHTITGLSKLASAGRTTVHVVLKDA